MLPRVNHRPLPSSERVRGALERFRISVSSSERGGRARPRSSPAVRGAAGAEEEAGREGRASVKLIPGPLLRAAYYERPLRSVPPCLTDVSVRGRGSG